MNKFLGVFLMSIFIYIFTSCSSNLVLNDDNDKKIRIGVTSVPYGEILQNIKNVFKEDFDIITYVDQDKLNKDLVDGNLDANFFQTREYLNRFNLTSEIKLVEITPVHVEPLIIYSSKYRTLDKVENEDIVYIPSDFINRNRSLKLLEDAGFVTLAEELDGSYTIINNPKNLIINQVDINDVPYYFNESDLIVLNTNVAMGNNINPKEVGIFYEKSFDNDLKFNIFVTREDMITSVKLKEIANYLNSYENFKFINVKYNGFVKPIF
ncbi:MetQ/NlpA family ABC transporter substrate-binding protein [Candidatus Arthromitus sp. SFB-rat-Yit]|uniref:MetQ/NlpA family ABC transporter substrate-binding protein n=1 Tax=Candidatus Arthromitus sp. SFB-rat-Yit TaxID=1041504 RepID=UPI000227A121|nr:MetQ/NlpA family ABC transporter substrate-binding protein [Candidatus Arthromitus sp. SFB-rat-Yit]BAK81864.1 putative TonB-dependent receptor [Candidatus Arthromitus sp. SFB-rat-Yit]